MDIEVDDKYGAVTQRRVKEMQGWKNLEQDGICGPQTWKAVDTYAFDAATRGTKDGEGDGDG